MQLEGPVYCTECSRRKNRTELPLAASDLELIAQEACADISCFSCYTKLARRPRVLEVFSSTFGGTITVSRADKSSVNYEFPFVVDGKEFSVTGACDRKAQEETPIFILHTSLSRVKDASAFGPVYRAEKIFLGITQVSFTQDMSFQYMSHTYCETCRNAAAVHMGTCKCHFSHVLNDRILAANMLLSPPAKWRCSLCNTSFTRIF